MHKKPYLQCTGPEWDRQRIFAMARDGCQCQWQRLGLSPIPNICDEKLPENRPRHLIVHHIQQRQHNGTHDLANLVTVCRAHHAEIHPHLRYEFEGPPEPEY